MHFQEFAQKPLGGFLVPAALDEDIQDETLLIHCAPEPVFLAPDFNDDFIEVPFIPHLPGRFPADPARKLPTELLRPGSHSLVRHDDPTRRQQILNHSQAERKLEVQPNRIGNHVRRETVAAIEVSVRHTFISHTRARDALTLRCLQHCGHVLGDIVPIA